MHFLPAMLAGLVCGVIVNLDKSILINAYFIAVIIATLITNFTFGIRRGGESFGAALLVTGPMCIWVVGFSMIISGLGLMAFLKLFGG